jgi:hypothetical protein
MSRAFKDFKWLVFLQILEKLQLDLKLSELYIIEADSCLFLRETITEGYSETEVVTDSWRESWKRGNFLQILFYSPALLAYAWIFEAGALRFPPGKQEIF